MGIRELEDATITGISVDKESIIPGSSIAEIQYVWVSVWKHGPMKVFKELSDAQEWNVMAPRILRWVYVTEDVWRGFVWRGLLLTSDDVIVRLFKREVL